MFSYTKSPLRIIDAEGRKISDFISDSKQNNLDETTVKSFGEEWSKFSSFSKEEIENIGKEYFDIVNDKIVNHNSSVLDIGCGSGRWSVYLAPKVNFIEAIDPSDAVFAASKLTSQFQNIRITKAGVDNIPFDNNSFDFVMSIGVLHHVPDTKAAITKASEKVKQGGYLMLYLYYALDNRGMIYKTIFYLSNFLRLIISNLPSFIKKIVCDFLAVFLYMPFVLLSRLFNSLGLPYKKIPLSYYSDKSFHIIRNDALDRLGTPLEKRFSKKQIEEMLTSCGMTNIVFSNQAPYWHCISQKQK